MNYKITVESTNLDGMLLFKPNIFSDARGNFYESWTLDDYQKSGIKETFLQDNCSYSQKGVLRGLHVQARQAKMLWVTYGHVFQVSVDIRPNSPTYGQHFSIELKHTEPVQVYLPPGFANGFYVLSNEACLNYKCSQYYTPQNESGISWSDPDLDINWPVKDPVVSQRDSDLPQLKGFDVSKV